MSFWYIRCIKRAHASIAIELYPRLASGAGRVWWQFLLQPAVHADAADHAY